MKIIKIATILLTGVLALSFGSKGIAQSNEGLNLGIKLGTSLTYFGETAKFEGGNPGLVAGGSVNYGLSNLLGLTAEVLFHQQRGTRNEVPVVETGYLKVTNRNLTMNTLEIPLQVALKFLKLNCSQLVFKPGYSFSYVMGVTSRDVNHFYYSDGTELKIRGSENLTSDYSKVQHAIVGSLGIETPLESGPFGGFSIEIKYRRGLSDIQTSYSVLGGTPSQVRSQSIQVVLGISF